MDDLELLEHRAVEAAINLDWKTAINANKKILKHEKNNLQALLRLGFAQRQNTQLDASQKTYRRVLKLQPSNQLARENLERLKVLSTKGAKKVVGHQVKFDPNLFLEIPGKTKSIVLVKLGQKNILAHLSIGQAVYLKPKRRKIELRTKSNEYVGSLPDDLSRNLIIFIKAGGEYVASIKEVSLNRVVVFIRELKKAKKYAKFPSFPKISQPEQMAKLPTDDEHGEAGEEEELFESEIDHMAESLHEEKEALPYTEEEEDDENLEE